MSTYARANTSAAWYQDNFPGAVMDPNAGVLHTTEGTSLPGYSGGATAPNYTAVPDFAAKRLRWFAHFPDERSSRALQNDAGGVETNTLNVVQVELVGTCDPRTAASWRAKGARFIFWPDAPDWALADLAHFIADMNRRHGIKVQGPGTGRWTPYPESYGAGGQRFSFTAWRNFYGWCGHQHVPENDHGDPGALDWGRVERMAKELLAPDPKPEPKPKGPRPVAKWRVEAAKKAGIQNAELAARACRKAGLPFWVACALLEKESHGRNVFGHDQGGAGWPGQPVTKERFQQFYREVLNGATSNGVGPCQITWAGSLIQGKRDGGYFREMLEMGLDPWDPEENMVFGFALLRKHYNALDDSWRAAGTAYNGRASYGADFLAKAKEWKARLKIKGTLNPKLDRRPAVFIK